MPPSTVLAHPPGLSGAEVSAGERAERTAKLVPLAEGTVATMAEEKRYGATRRCRMNWQIFASRPLARERLRSYDPEQAITHEDMVQRFAVNNGLAGPVSPGGV